RRLRACNMAAPGPDRGGQRAILRAHAPPRPRDRPPDAAPSGPRGARAGICAATLAEPLPTRGASFPKIAFARPGGAAHAHGCSLVSNFESLGLAAPLLRALAEEGYETPTPIQARAIPPALA